MTSYYVGRKTDADAYLSCLKPHWKNRIIWRMGYHAIAGLTISLVKIEPINKLATKILINQEINSMPSIAIILFICPPPKTVGIT
jgi:hypothetical protein